MQIGPYQLKNQLIVAPMAGVTDQVFRNLCLRYGAALRCQRCFHLILMFGKQIKAANA